MSLKVAKINTYVIDTVNTIAQSDIKGKNINHKIYVQFNDWEK